MLTRRHISRQPQKQEEGNRMCDIQYQPADDQQAHSSTHLLAHDFYTMFDVVPAITDELKEEAHHLRFKIFCLQEKGYEDPSKYPDGQEKDEFDSHTNHVLLKFKPTGQALGVIRVIFPDGNNLAESFPIQTLMKREEAPQLHGETARHMVEFSRLGIADDVRRDIRAYMGTPEAASLTDQFKAVRPDQSRMLISMAPLGLFRGAFELTLNHDIVTGVSVMTPHNREKLSAVGMVWHRLGEDREYHGIRTPFQFNIREIFENCRKNRPEVWHMVSPNGSNHEQAERISTRTRAFSV